MLRGLRLPGKMVFAAVPLILALTATAALLVRGSFQEANRERDTAIIAGSLDDLSQVLAAVRSEAEPFVDAPIDGRGDAGLRAATDESIAIFRAELERVGSDPLLRQVDLGVSQLVELRLRIDDGEAGITPVTNPIPEAYESIANEFLQVTSLMPVEAASVQARRELEALAAISRARLAAGVQDRIILEEMRQTSNVIGTASKVADANAEVLDWISAFETVADAEVLDHFIRSGVPQAVQAAEEQIQVLIARPFDGVRVPQSEWSALLDARWEALVAFEIEWIETIVADSAAEASRATQDAWVVAGVAIGAMLLAAIATALVSRSIVRRVRTVTDRARQVAQEQLPALVEALRDPNEDATLPTMPPIRDRGADEVGDLARSFAAMQSTLEDVARQQLETLRKGVADMFVTLARRNRSLIDRQLALIDQLEAHEENPETLSDFYRLDHLATRMRRNAESLLVLAGSETPRAWQRSLEIDDVVRAAVGEIEDYRRVDILALEGLRVRGGAVADVSHLLSELLENSTAFSSPETRVRVAGHFHDTGYLITVSDRGVGLGESRLVEVNRLLDSPPVIGLALEPTLGLYVVAMLAKRHGIRVRLVPGAPGVTAQILLPKALFEVEPMGAPAGDETGRIAAAGVAAPAPVVTPRRHRHVSDPSGPVETRPGVPGVEPSVRPMAPVADGVVGDAPTVPADLSVRDPRDPAPSVETISDRPAASAPGHASDSSVRIRPDTTGRIEMAPPAGPGSIVRPRPEGSGAPGMTPPESPGSEGPTTSPEPDTVGARSAETPEPRANIPLRHPSQIPARDVRSDAPVEPPPARETAPDAPATTTNGLPTRVPGASFVDTTPERPMVQSPVPASGLRNALSSYQAGKERAGESRSTMQLPNRVPGTSFTEEDAGGDETITNQSPRKPDSIRSAFGAYQTGLETGRRHTHDEEEDS